MIGGDKIGEGSYGCIYNPSLNKDGSDSLDKKTVTKIQKFNRNAQNEIEIGKIVKQLDGYINHFAPVINYENVNLVKIKKNLFNDCAILENAKKKSNKLIMMKMDFIKGDDFIDYLIKNKGSIEIIKNLISSYGYLLKSIKLLTDIKVVHFDLKGDNILFNNQNEIPIMIDFGLSININLLINKNVTIDTLQQFFYVFGPDYYIWPIEVHYICYLLNENDEPSDNEIKKIVNTCVRENVALSYNLSKEFQNKYLQSSYNYLKKINKLSLSEKINKVLSYWYTWDNYSLSIIYLKFMYYLNINGYINNEFISFFSEILLTNIHPDPEKRLNVNKTRQKFTEFIYNMSIENIVQFQEMKEMFIFNKEDIAKAMKLEKKNLRQKSKKFY